MPEVAAWERVWIDAELFSEDVHSEINCTDCHGGEAVDDMEQAHIKMVDEVVTDPEASCGQCHEDIAPAAANSLHFTLQGYDTALYMRSEPSLYDSLKHMQANHCDSCHADCGDCHVSQPTSVGGGLLSGHDFVRTPPMSRTCTACHGSRIKNEYYGSNEDVPSDVHFKARMACTECHTGDEMHGMDITAPHRYDSVSPTCQSCHENIMVEDAEIEEHAAHPADAMACQVCHSTTYTNCVNCHVSQTGTGVPYYTVEEHYLGFFIGRNPEPTEDRPYHYVPVRHVPADVNAFSFYADSLLPNFDNRPTWLLATPHNIQRNTPQTESCRNCHARDDYFLTEEKVAPAELEANRDVIVEEPPEIRRNRD